MKVIGIKNLSFMTRLFNNNFKVFTLIAIALYWHPATIVIPIMPNPLSIAIMK
jgi:hypothetical protein